MLTDTNGWISCSPRYVHLPSRCHRQYWNVPTCARVVVREDFVHAVLSTERKTLLCPGCRSFQVHLLGLDFLYLCICFLLWFGEVSSIISANTFLIRFLVSSPSGTSVIYWSASFILPHRSLILQSFKETSASGSYSDGSFLTPRIMCLLLYVTHSAVYCSAFALVSEFSFFLFSPYGFQLLFHSNLHLINSPS